jgi:murein DD-endopeptidase MepM/ murein hydrolase activator NlpD
VPASRRRDRPRHSGLLPFVLAALVALAPAGFGAAAPAAAAPGPTAPGPAPGPAGSAGSPVGTPGAGRVPTLRPPVAGPVVRGFELPAGPYGPGHRGVDLAAPLGVPVRAPAAGRVAFAAPVAGTVWSSLLVAPGVVVTVGPLAGPLARVGRGVRAGDALGRLAPGHGGALHLGLRVDGAYVDPLPFLVGLPRPRLVPMPLNPR